MSLSKQAVRYEIVSSCISLGDFDKARRTTKSADHIKLNTAFRRYVRRTNKHAAEPLSDVDAWVAYRERLIRLAPNKSGDDDDDDDDNDNDADAYASVGASSATNALTTAPPAPAIGAFESDLCSILDRAMPGLFLACGGQLPESMRHPITPFQRQVADSFVSFMCLSDNAIRLQCTQRHTKGLIVWTRELKRRLLSSFTDSDLVSLRCQLSYRPWSYDIGDVATAGRDGLVVVVRTWDDADATQRIYWAVRLKDAQRNPPVLNPRFFLEEDLADAVRRDVKLHKELVRQITADRQSTERLQRIEELTRGFVDDDGDYMSAGDSEDDTKS
jgi:hypothetical protein